MRQLCRTAKACGLLDIAADGFLAVQVVAARMYR